MDDISHMRAALALARRGLGTTWPNPSVGCVIVREGRVVGRGVTAEGGRPHAETVALAMAGAAARGATAYVTLEPCNHHGRTPPCTEALIAAGIARVVIALRDENPVAQGGIARLRAAGLAVDEAVLAQEADEVAAGFLSVLRRGRPLVTLKLASTLDGRIATRSGESQWITGTPARRAGHALRGRHDAVMVGVGTALTDDPDLRCRIDGFRTRPVVRVVADSRLRLRLMAKLVSTTSAAPTWVLARPDADPQRRAALESTGVEIMPVPGAEMGVDLAASLAALAERGITRLLVEGGAQLAAALLRADLVDRLAWFHAPTVMGGDGWPAAQAFGVQRLAHMPRFVRQEGIAVGQDWLTLLQRDRSGDADLIRPSLLTAT
jgi:diaminohydroxyphosphoribosylaminopyrimidine deaminase/5-amino-6-(5-phosphoribosylamino)uracil reductase